MANVILDQNNFRLGNIDNTEYWFLVDVEDSEDNIGVFVNMILNKFGVNFQSIADSLIGNKRMPSLVIFIAVIDPAYEHGFKLILSEFTSGPVKEKFSIHTVSNMIALFGDLLDNPSKPLDNIDVREGNIVIDNNPITSSLLCLMRSIQNLLIKEKSLECRQGTFRLM